MGNFLYRFYFILFLLPFTVIAHSDTEPLYYLFTNKVISSDTAVVEYHSGKFKSYSTSLKNFKYNSSSAYWLYIPKSNTSIGSRYLFHQNPGFDSITVYRIVNGKTIKVEDFGLRVAYKGVNNPNNYIVELESGIDYILRYKNSAPIAVIVQLVSHPKLIYLLSTEKIKIGLYWVFLAIMGIMVLLFYSQVKETIYLSYFGFLVGLFLISFNIRGYLFTTFFPNHPEWNQFNYGIIALSASLTVWFVYYFLEVKKFHEPISRLYFFLFITFISIFFINFFITSAQTLFLMQIVGLLQVIIFLLSAFVVYQKGNKNAIYFIVGWITYLCAAVYFSLSTLNLAPTFTWSAYSLEYASSIEILFFSYVIAARFKNYKQAEAQKQQELIDLLKDREYILSQQKEALEKEVKKRTEEIQSQNIQLKHLNNDLNLIVEERTLELKKSLVDKENTNNQLQQFTYITSHNLRGPIASLKGLLGLYQHSTSPTEKSQLIDRANMVVDTMNQVLVDLNTVLTQKEVAQYQKEIIDIESLLKEIKILLPLQDAHIVILKNNKTPLKGIRPFFISIFYNLISNALKYSKEDQKIEIHIHLLESEFESIIQFKDNGIGIDLTKYQDKIFGFYKRFNYDKEGKGIGLFMTKTQVELMGGSITVDSVPDEGTTFTLRFPKSI
ncbi:MAG: sensor histidine kinase [Cytophagaceae bacterium]|nr:sensor histidine kinase [Cytophagaceae bacterium]